MLRRSLVLPMFSALMLAGAAGTGHAEDVIVKCTRGMTISVEPKADPLGRLMGSLQPNYLVRGAMCTDTDLTIYVIPSMPGQPTFPTAQAVTAFLLYLADNGEVLTKGKPTT